MSRNSFSVRVRLAQNFHTLRQHLLQRLDYAFDSRGLELFGSDITMIVLWMERTFSALRLRKDLPPALSTCRLLIDLIIPRAMGLYGEVLLHCN